MSAFRQFDEPMLQSPIPVPDGVYGDATHIPVLTIVGGLVVNVQLVEIAAAPAPSGGITLLDEDNNTVLDEDGNKPQPE